jgi:hypothetical protein
MRKRPQLGISVVALVIALLGWTPIGQAASNGIAKVVPYANVAGFAKNAGKLNGHVSSRAPRAGQIPVVNATGKLPASLGAVGPAGSPGPAGPAGAAGAAGPPGVSGYQQVTQQTTVGSGNTDRTVSCPGGKSGLAGGYNLDGGASDLKVYDMRPTSGSDWRFRIHDETGQSYTVTLYVICATVTS